MFTRDIGILELDLDPTVHTAPLLRTLPMWAWSSYFGGWATPDMTLYYAEPIGHPVMLEPGAPIVGCTMRYERLHNCSLDHPAFML